MTDVLDALRASVVRLRAIVEPLTGDQLRLQSYATEWSIADVLSHLGSDAVMRRMRLDAELAKEDLRDDFAQPIWDEWNAKTPEAKAADALAADITLTRAFDSITESQRAGIAFPFGPITLDFAGGVGMRLNEHALHTWDIEVVFDPSVTVPARAARFIVDNLGLIVQFAGKPNGTTRDVRVRTTDPTRDLTLALGADAVSVAPCEDAHTPDLELPAESFARLVYGRLDADHTPQVSGNADLDELRRVFPGL